MSRCGFDQHFPVISDAEHVGRSCIFYGEMATQVLDPFLNWITWFLLGKLVNPSPHRQMELMRQADRFLPAQEETTIHRNYYSELNGTSSFAEGRFKLKQG